MAQEYNDDNDTIQMLLDVDHYYGEHESSAAPKIIFILVAAIPIVIYVYFGLFFILPMKIFAPFYAFYFIRVLCIIIGQEPRRVAEYKKKLEDIYSSLYSLLRIRKIHDNGMVEYLNGHITYFVVAYNGNDKDALAHSGGCDKFIEMCAGDHDYDSYIQNVTERTTLKERYKNVKFFGDREMAQIFVDVIDHNSKMVQERSTLQKVIFGFKGSKSDWKELKQNIDNAINSHYSKMFKLCYRVTDKEEIEDILSRDLDGVISIDEMAKRKYCTGEYYGSKVLCYDDNKEQLARQTQGSDINRRENTNYSSNNFHVIYNGEENK